MFTKKKKIGGGQYGVYKDVIDWDAVWEALGFGLFALFVLFLLKSCGG